MTAKQIADFEKCDVADLTEALKSVPRRPHKNKVLAKQKAWDQYWWHKGSEEDRRNVVDHGAVQSSSLGHMTDAEAEGIEDMLLSEQQFEDEVAPLEDEVDVGAQPKKKPRPAAKRAACPLNPLRGRLDKVDAQMSAEIKTALTLEKRRGPICRDRASANGVCDRAFAAVSGLDVPATEQQQPAKVRRVPSPQRRSSNRWSSSSCRTALPSSRHRARCGWPATARMPRPCP